MACIRLIRTRNIGPMTYSLLIKRYGSEHKALRAIPELARRGGRKLEPASLKLAEAEMAANEAANATFLYHGVEDYPERLDQFDDAPEIISVKGNQHLLARPAIAMVGARNASLNALRHVEKLAGDLGKEGYVITSSLARGIAAATHRGALATGTIAVIASGIDTCYPQENSEFQQMIVETGLLVAEMPPGTQPTARHFSVRNRIIANLALVVVEVEAAARSGSLITAREAAERGGEVRAIPGSPLVPRSSGCNILIRDGATLAQNSEDIIECLARPIRAGVPALAE